MLINIFRFFLLAVMSNFFFATLPVSQKWNTSEIGDLSGVGEARYFLSTNKCSYREYSVHWLRST